MSDQIKSIARRLWIRSDSIIPGMLGLLCAFAWAIFPVPRQDDLTEVRGNLAKWTVETDRSWLGKFSIRRHSYVLFTVDGSDARYWNGAVGPANVAAVFPVQGVPLRFWRLRHYPFHKISGDGEKTYGLTVDGKEIESLEDNVAADKAGLTYLFPPMGILMLGLATYTWRRRTRRAALSEDR